MNDEPKTADQIGPAHGERPAPLRDSVSTATQRIQLIIEAAEKAAAGIIADAEAQARLYLEETRRRADRVAGERAGAMSDITDSLIDRAEAVKRQSDELIVALDQAKTQIDEGVRERLTPTSDPVPAPSLRQADELRRATPHLTPVEPESTVEGPLIPPEAEPRVSAHPAATAPSSAVAPSAGARLIATQMVVAGSSRIEIENRLRNEFGIQEAGPMLDTILGPEV